MKSKRASAYLDTIELKYQSFDIIRIATKTAELAEEELAEAHEAEMQQLREKYATDIKTLCEKWTDSDEKLDAIYNADVADLRAEVEHYKKALDEANERLKIAEKVIADKNAKK